MRIYIVYSADAESTLSLNVDKKKNS